MKTDERSPDVQCRSQPQPRRIAKETTTPAKSPSSPNQKTIWKTKDRKATKEWLTYPISITHTNKRKNGVYWEIANCCERAPRAFRKCSPCFFPNLNQPHKQEKGNGVYWGIDNCCERALRAFGKCSPCLLCLSRNHSPCRPCLPCLTVSSFANLLFVMRERM